MYSSESNNRHCPHCDAVLNQTNLNQNDVISCHSCGQTINALNTINIATNTYSPAIQKTEEKPVSLIVFGILSCISGGFGTLCTPFALIPILIPEVFGAIDQIINFTPELKLWMGINTTLNMLASILLLCAGIGLLQTKKWAPKAAFIYAIISIILTVIGFLVTLFNPIGQQMPGFEASRIMGLLGTLGGFIFPVLLLIFMRKENIINACNK